MFETIFTLLFLLIAGHAVADFALQTEWIALHKNRHNKDNPSLGPKGQVERIWFWVLSAHSFHHGLMVFLITQRIWLGVLETVVHWITDYGKSENWYGFHVDQVLHIAAKVVWVALLFFQLV